MSKSKLTAEQKRLDIDLGIIIAVSLAVLGICMVFQEPLYGIMRNARIHVLLRTLLAAACQFGLAGLGISIVSIYRNERFGAHGLKIRGTLLSIVLCVLCFVPYIIFGLATKQITSYLPFQSVWMTKDALSNGFPVNAVTMLIIATAWGFFEGFNYVVISDKVNQRYPSKNRWLNWGAITGAIVCILIHGLIGVTPEGILEMLAVMIIIYGMLMAKEYTGNAWGCVFIFVFLWNAF
jgi:hypothetical protein